VWAPKSPGRAAPSRRERYPPLPFRCLLRCDR